MEIACLKGDFSSSLPFDVATKSGPKVSLLCGAPVHVSAISSKAENQCFDKAVREHRAMHTRSHSAGRHLALCLYIVPYVEYTCKVCKALVSHIVPSIWVGSTKGVRGGGLCVTSIFSMEVREVMHGGGTKPAQRSNMALKGLGERPFHLVHNTPTRGGCSVQVTKTPTMAQRSHEARDILSPYTQFCNCPRGSATLCTNPTAH